MPRTKTSSAGVLAGILSKDYGLCILHSQCTYHRELHLHIVIYLFSCNTTELEIIFLKGKKTPQTSEKYYIFSSYLPLPTKVSVDHSYLNTHPVQTNLRVPVYMELACMCKFAYLQIFLTYRYVDKHFLLSRKPFTHVSLISLCP